MKQTARQTDGKKTPLYVIILSIAAGLTLICAPLVVFFILPPILAHRAAHKTFERARQSLDPESLRAWAVQSISELRPGEFPTRDKLPPALRKLQPYPPSGVVNTTNCNGHEPYITILRGNGFFHWGIDIGPTNYLKAVNLPDLYSEQWVPGIYFVHEGKD